MSGADLQSDTLPLSIVVPCFNEELGLDELARRCCASASAVVGEDYELVLVDDGSSDGTWPTITRLLAQYPRIVALKLSRNFGHQVALTAGLSAVRGQAILVIDADLQDPPELLGDMLKVMREKGADVVYGQRKSRAGDSWFKTTTASLFYRMLERATDIMIPVDTGDFRLMSRRVSDLIASMPERDRFIRGMVASVGFKQIAFPYDRQARFAGTTKYPLSKMIRFASDAFLGYSMVLLRFSSVAALAMLLALVVVAGYSLYSWAYLEVVPGWTSLMITIIMVSFFQLVALSVIGEYVGRIYLSSKERPLFIVDAVERGHK
ncbi:glycosyltransferase family 2 protein [Bradyrhizobium genosp. L]|uniref:glycosyltransferase family 2 protein n=1 Tax=Bradyrhizobium genosp. L TaxID=83637 RepID=UPI0018A27588|nr:glycosyltransferase family 2 protein [Bradyrhizobium genosp. L]QPF85700.1 glycosyltransferase family 2 protein [Bradyrhizobium genosp. L]